MSSEILSNYDVEVSQFAERHYIKKFRKKYKRAWDITEVAVVQECARIDTLIGQTEIAETIKCNGHFSLVKLNFKIAGTKDSAKTSGDRAIIFVDNQKRDCQILLVYSKNEICSPNETQKWQSAIKENFPEIWNVFI